MDFEKEVQRATLLARQFIGYTKLERLVHEDAIGSSTVEMLRRLQTIESELQRLSATLGSTTPAGRQARTLKAAVSTSLTVIRQLWKSKHGRPLPVLLPSVASTPMGARRAAFAHARVVA